MNPLQKVDGERYINLETFRKNGLGVRTPVWFVQEGEFLYVRTQAGSGKMKRLRNNPQMNIASCRMNGEPKSPWIPAAGREAAGREIDRKVDQLLDQKYGLIKMIFDLGSAMLRRAYTIIEIKTGE